MANEDTPDLTPTGGEAPPNGQPESEACAEPARERFRLRAQCEKLRHWCRDLLRDADGAQGVLPPETERELLGTPPAMSMDEVFAALYVVSQRQPLPPEAATLAGDVAALAAERQRLSGLFFKLFDAVFPDEPPLTDEHFRELSEQPPGPSISEMIDQLEREFGGKG